jgi:hypothetical protein
MDYHHTIATDLGFFKEFSSKGYGIYVKRKPDAFANGLRTLERSETVRLLAVQVSESYLLAFIQSIVIKHLILRWQGNILLSSPP